MSSSQDFQAVHDHNDAIDSYFECITACTLGEDEQECITQCLESHLKTT
ncbi:hypothetical protein [Prochlorococcus marinus]|nr:hypothetical protein [Prochlorococcus marinus]